MTIEISAFAWVPEFAQGHVRDLRPRWALIEAGLAYRVHLLKAGENRSADYLRWQPFGQVPAYRDDEVQLFESGAILLHIANKSRVLEPRDWQDAANMQSWVLAALNSVEPMVADLTNPPIFNVGEDWVAGARKAAEQAVEGRLSALAVWLADRDWLTGRFSVADIVMATVLRDLGDEPVLQRFPVVEAYRDRCLARPAFQKALAAQMAVFAENAPA